MWYIRSTKVWVKRTLCYYKEQNRVSSQVSTSWFMDVDQCSVIEVNEGNIIHVNVVNLQLPNSDTILYSLLMSNSNKRTNVDEFLSLCVSLPLPHMIFICHQQRQVNQSYFDPFWNSVNSIGNQNIEGTHLIRRYNNNNNGRQRDNYQWFIALSNTLHASLDIVMITCKIMWWEPRTRIFINVSLLIISHISITADPSRSRENDNMIALLWKMLVYDVILAQNNDPYCSRDMSLPQTRN